MDNFEYIIYRAKLSTYEVKRVKIKLENLKRFLIFIEDREFYKHKGISLRAISRAIAGLFGAARRSGGSTITQQLVRTLFIEDLQKTFRRKVVEILLAKWFEKISSKNQILEMYLTSVRFERKIFGVAEAMKLFFGEIVNDPTNAQAFFLIERVSNVKSKILCSKIDHTISQALTDSLLSKDDATQIMDIYEAMIKEGVLSPDDHSRFLSLRRNWGAPTFT